VPPRPSIPADDLYARLEVPVDAGPEVIEVAWRSLLRQHHPDVAGDTGLERAKRINVAHDWLSDPDLRAHYDAERGIRRSVRATGGRSPRTAEPPPVRPNARPRRRPLDPAEALARFLDRVASLTPDEVDRLAFADPTPIAFRAAIARFLPEEQLAALSSMETAVDARLDPVAAGRPVVRDAIDAYATELVLAAFLDELLSEPFRDRARERLTRGWEAAVGQPRYGPNGVAVRGLLARLAELDGGGITALAATARRAHLDEQPDPPWPAGTSVDDDEALRVSSLLAQQDAVAALADGRSDPATTARARRVAARLAHLLVLRHAFPPATFAALTKPWRPRFLPDERSGPRVRRPR
jgi:curved DNA-binding protein CbpA